MTSRSLANCHPQKAVFRGSSLVAPFLAMVVLLALAGRVSGAPEAELWERWTANDPSATASIEHRVWDGFLNKYVQTSPGDINRVAYGAVSEPDQRLLNAYLAALGEVPISSYNRNEQLAYWINFYNALTVKVVLDHYPVESIMDISISPGLFAVGPWGKKLVEVEGEMLSLDDIEHRILRPIWRDPRIHYAVNCASYGCPDLAADAFTGDSVERMLDVAANNYINSDRGVLIDDGNLYVSDIYQWFKDDFGGTDAGVIAHLRGFAEPSLEARLAGQHRISDGYYDWALNDGVEPPESASAGNGQTGKVGQRSGSTTR